MTPFVLKKISEKNFGGFKTLPFKAILPLKNSAEEITGRPIVPIRKPHLIIFCCIGLALNSSHRSPDPEIGRDVGAFSYPERIWEPVRYRYGFNTPTLGEIAANT